MQLFVRPSPPGGLEKFDEDVQGFREHIETLFDIAKAAERAKKEAEGAAVVVEGEASPKKKKGKEKKEKTEKKGKKGKKAKTGETEKKPKDPFSPKWTAYKHVFAEAQSGKCGYCEMMVIGGQPGDVEHYWPKGEVWQLKGPEKVGQEKRWASTLEGRQRDVISETGYWWMAYDWSNYLLACIVCNEYWKLSYFPVAETPRRLPPAAQAQEVPLLLNPFDVARNPADHLAFDFLGQVHARDKSPCGVATISTCGLDRESLRRARMEKARRAHRLAQDLNEAADEKKINELLADFYELGRDEYVHSGMVRSIFEERCGLSWIQLKQMVEPAPAEPKPAGE